MTLAAARAPASVPLWLPLAVAMLGVVGTLVGVVVTQRRSDRREAVLWELEREHQRQAWDREDVARTFEQRRQAYADFYAQLRVSSGAIMTLRLGFQPSAAGWDWDLQEALAVLSFYASPAVERAASAAYAALMETGEGTQPVVRWVNGRPEAVDEAELARRDGVAAAAAVELLRVLRVDLGMAVGPAK